MSTNYFPNLEIPEELQLKLTELVTAPTVSGSAGTWTPNLVVGSGATPIADSLFYQSIGGIVTATLGFFMVVSSPQEATSLTFTNLPLWDGTYNAQNPIIHAFDIATFVPYTITASTPSGIAGSKQLNLTLPALSAGNLLRASLLYQYPEAA